MRTYSIAIYSKFKRINLSISLFFNIHSYSTIFFCHRFQFSSLEFQSIILQSSEYHSHFEGFELSTTN